jgi:hypothetical protein
MLVRFLCDQTLGLQTTDVWIGDFGRSITLPGRLA